jgi:group I intron endonuclease
MREKICGIYCFENLVNGKKYIGKSIDIEKRQIVHLSNLRRNLSNNKYLQNSWNKYGENNFKFYILKILPNNEIDEMEKYYIKKLKSKYPNGYNMTDGGDGTVGRKMSSETRNKISIGNTGKKYSQELKLKLSLAHKGIKFTEEHKRKISLSSKTKGKKLKPRSQETRNKISLSRKGFKVSDETKLKISLSSKNRKPPSEETKRKISKSIKIFWKKRKEKYEKGKRN